METGHIEVHESGAVEAFGHKVITLPGENSKDVKMTQRYARVTQKKLFEDMDKFIAATVKDFILAL